MTIQQILYDAQEHEKWIHHMRVLYGKCSPFCPTDKHFSKAHATGVEAAESRAKKLEDIESDAVPLAPTLHSRLKVGFAMLGRENY